MNFAGKSVNIRTSHLLLLRSKIFPHRPLLGNPRIELTEVLKIVRQYYPQVVLHECFTVRLNLHIKPEFTSRDLKCFSKKIKLSQQGVELTKLTIIVLEVR